MSEDSWTISDEECEMVSEEDSLPSPEAFASMAPADGCGCGMHEKQISDAHRTHSQRSGSVREADDLPHASQFHPPA